MTHLACPTCGLVLNPRARLVSPQYCPRCLARRRTAIALVADEPASPPAGSRFSRRTPEAVRASAAGTARRARG